MSEQNRREAERLGREAIQADLRVDGNLFIPPPPMPSQFVPYSSLDYNRFQQSRRLTSSQGHDQPLLLTAPNSSSSLDASNSRPSPPSRTNPIQFQLPTTPQGTIVSQARPWSFAQSNVADRSSNFEVPLSLEDKYSIVQEFFAEDDYHRIERQQLQVTSMTGSPSTIAQLLPTSNRSSRTSLTLGQDSKLLQDCGDGCILRRSLIRLKEQPAVFEAQAATINQKDIRILQDRKQRWDMIRDAYEAEIKLACENQAPSGELAPIAYNLLKPWQTRLIEILPSGWAPRCRLITVEFIDMDGVGIPETAEIVQYLALPYVWNSSERSCQIICNGGVVNVSWNLAEAIYHLAQKGDIKYLWDDGVCIHQENPREKASQIRNMLRIFEKAHTVIGWLDGSPNIPEHNTELLTEASSKRHNEECKTALIDIQCDIDRIFTQSFWSRTWIRQEVFVAKQLRLHGAGYSIWDVSFEQCISTAYQWLSIGLLVDGYTTTVEQEEVMTQFGIM